MSFSETFIEYYSGFHQFVLDKTHNKSKERWFISAVVTLIYLLNVLRNNSHYIVTYVAFVYIIQGFILWATPKSSKITNLLDENQVIEDELDENEMIDFNVSPFVRNLPELDRKSGV